MNASYRQGAALVSHRRYAEAIPLLVKTCSEAPDAAEPWLMLGLSLIAQGKAAELYDIVETRHRIAGDGLKLFYDCLLTALIELDHASLRHVIDRTPSDSALIVVARYVSGLVAASAGDAQRGIGEIVAAARMSAMLPADLASTSEIETIVHEAALLATFETVAQYESSDPGHLLAELGSVQAAAEFAGPPPIPPAARFIFFSSCDERYLDTFGATAVRALDATGVETIYHLHIVDPTPALATKLAALQESCSSLLLRHSTERYRRDHAGYSRAEYYACARLVRLPEIFARYDRDVFLWDVDTAAVRDLPALAAAMDGCDLGYFAMKKTRPTLICHLATVYFANTPTMRQCADTIRAYVLAKLLKTPYWLLDQGAVYCASEYFAAMHPDFHVRDFSIVPGGEFAAHVNVAGCSAEKQAMRRDAGGKPAAP